MVGIITGITFFIMEGMSISISNPGYAPVCVNFMASRI